MSHRESLWKWLVCSSVAVGILIAFCFAVPRHWIAAFFSPLGPLVLPPSRAPTVLFVHPVPEIVTEEPAPGERTVETIPETVPQDPAWWTAAWQVHIGEQTAGLLRSAAKDSLTALAIEILDSALAALRRGERDTSLANRLALWQHNEREKFLRLKPYLDGLAHSRRYREVLNQEAWLFGEFLAEEISVPDPHRERGR